MPTFVQLAQYVIEKLKVSDDAFVSQAFRPWIDRSLSASTRTPLDQIFNTLQHEYGRDQVCHLVTQRLSISDPNMPASKQHVIVGKLSSNQNGIPQIVTTNFDLLFEHSKVTHGLPSFEPPTFPDLIHDRPPSGITYLHGRLNTNSPHSQDYVLSSADLGRAYLAEGWATHFVRMLLKKYTVVLLGYQANDPPVNYLLQGLNTTGMLDKNRLFAFDCGEPLAISAKWRDRGVTTIPYREHSILWETLEAWANRATSPSNWRSSVLALASRGPGQLLPHERGQVCHLVRSSIGANLFANASPPTPSEWICVFDRTCRLATVVGPCR